MNKVTSWIILAVFLFGCSSVQATGMTMNSIYMLLLNGQQDEVSYDLTVIKSGNGVITNNPAGIACGVDCNSYSIGTYVELTAEPDAGAYFKGWTEGVCSGTGTCAVTMNEAITVTAEFSSSPLLTLTVQTTGNGSATSLDGINCAPDSQCDKNYTYNTMVSLTATPDAATETFMGWHVTGGNPGECSGGGPSCTVTMNETKTVEAVFAELPVYTEADTAVTALDTIRAGVLGYIGDAIRYNVSTDGPRTVTVHFDHPWGGSTGEHWLIQVWREGAPDVMLANVTVFNGAAFNVTLPAAGNYYFVVKSIEEPGNISYRLTLLSNDGFVADPAEEEVNDSMAAANDLVFDQTVNGSIMRLDDEDWFRISADNDRPATVVFSGNSGDSAGDWEVMVYPSDGVTLQDPIARVEVKEGSAFNIPETGSPYYYVMVRDMYRSNNATVFNSTPYWLTVRSNDGQPMPFAELEANDFQTDATDAGAVDTVMTGQLMTKDDLDWFKFNGTAGTGVTVSFSTLETVGSALWYFSLHDSNGNELDGTYGDRQGQNFTFPLADTGDYYIQIHFPSIFDYSSSQYTVSVEAQ